MIPDKASFSVYFHSDILVEIIFFLVFVVVLVVVRGETIVASGSFLSIYSKSMSGS
jgi:hypothetical protein